MVNVSDPKIPNTRPINYSQFGKVRVYMAVTITIRIESALSSALIGAIG